MTIFIFLLTWDTNPHIIQWESIDLPLPVSIIGLFGSLYAFSWLADKVLPNYKKRVSKVSFVLLHIIFFAVSLGLFQVILSPFSACTVQHIDEGGIRWYTFFFMLALVSIYVMISLSIKTLNYPKIWVDQFFLMTFIAIVIGARLGHVLFYDIMYYASHPLEIFQVWKGGLASHGAIIAVFITAFIISHRKQVSRWLIIDILAFSFPIAAGLIRLGNFFNSEIYGVETGLLWGVVFSSVDSLTRHPSQLYEMFLYFTVFFVTLWSFKTFFVKKKYGITMGFTMLLMSLSRFFVEFIKVPQANFASNWLLNMGQWLTVPLIITGVLILYNRFTFYNNTNKINEN